MEKYSPPSLFFHLDLDAFYCQVVQKRPNINSDLPVCVQQWANVIAVNYPARALGVKRHMAMVDIKKLSSNVQFAPVWTYCIDSCPECADERTRPPPLNLPCYFEASKKVSNDANTLKDTANNAKETTNSAKEIANGEKEGGARGESPFDYDFQSIVPRLHLKMNAAYHKVCLDEFRYASKDIFLVLKKVFACPDIMSVDEAYVDLGLTVKRIFDDSKLIKYLQKPDFDAFEFMKYIKILQNNHLILAQITENFWEGDECVITEEKLTSLVEIFFDGNKNMMETNAAEIFDGIGALCVLSNEPFKFLSAFFVRLESICAVDGNSSLSADEILTLHNKLSANSCYFANKKFEEFDENDKKLFFDDLFLFYGVSISKFIKNQILLQEGYTCSVGVSSSRMIAKLCSSSFKPSKLSFLRDAHVSMFLHNLPVRSIPLLGGKLGEEIHEKIARHHALTGGDLKNGVEGEKRGGERGGEEKRGEEAKGDEKSGENEGEKEGEKETGEETEREIEEENEEKENGENKADGGLKVRDVIKWSVEDWQQKFNFDVETAKFICDRFAGGKGEKKDEKKIEKKLDGKNSILSVKSFSGIVETWDLCLSWVRVLATDIVRRVCEQESEQKRLPHTVHIGVSFARKRVTKFDEISRQYPFEFPSPGRNFDAICKKLIHFFFEKLVQFLMPNHSEKCAVKLGRHIFDEFSLRKIHIGVSHFSPIDTSTFAMKNLMQQFLTPNSSLPRVPLRTTALPPSSLSRVPLPQKKTEGESVSSFIAACRERDTSSAPLLVQYAPPPKRSSLFSKFPPVNGERGEERRVEERRGGDDREKNGVEKGKNNKSKKEEKNKKDLKTNNLSRFFSPVENKKETAVTKNASPETLRSSQTVLDDFQSQEAVSLSHATRLSVSPSLPSSLPEASTQNASKYFASKKKLASNFFAPHKKKKVETSDTVINLDD